MFPFKNSDLFMAYWSDSFEKWILYRYTPSIYRNVHASDVSLAPPHDFVSGSRRLRGFLQKQPQPLQLVTGRGCPLPPQVLHVHTPRGSGQHQGQEATAGFLCFPHNGHGHQPEIKKHMWCDPEPPDYPPPPGAAGGRGMLKTQRAALWHQSGDGFLDLTPKANRRDD